MAAVNETLRTWGRAEGVAEAGLSIDTALVNFALVNAELDKWRSSDATAHIDLDTSAAVAKLAALRTLDAAAISNFNQFQINRNLAGFGTAAAGSALGSAGGGGGGGAGFLGGLFGGGAAGGGNILSRLLWGGGSGIAGLGGLAAFGSLGSLAGFGPEHAITLGLGLAGSAAGAGIGGGLLAAGALGTSAVGLGTDLAGIGQAAGDIRTTTTNMTALNTAIAEYGRNSAQAAAAQTTFNQGLASFSVVARGAVVQAANTAQQFKAMFDQLTGPAEKIGAEIITQAMQVGENFLPTIGRFAAQNMGIIQRDLQPLFAWLAGPGLAIFTDLEKKFQSELPTAIHAFTQGIELFIRTIDLAAKSTGGLLIHVDNFLTRMNGAEWSKWSGYVEKFIADFRLWDAFVVILIKDIAALFSKDVGTASGIIVVLTQALERLHAWIQSSAGSAQLTNIFQVHKDQILALLPVIGNLIAQYTHLFFTVAPVAVQITVLLVKAFGDLLAIIEKVGPLGTYALAIGLIGTKLFGLQGLFKLAFSTEVVSTALTTMGADFTVFADAVATKLGLIKTDAAVAATGVTEATATMDTDLAGVGAAADAAAGQEAVMGTAATAAAASVGTASLAMVSSLGAILGPLALVILGFKTLQAVANAPIAPPANPLAAGAPIAATGNLQTAIAELKALPPMSLASTSPAYIKILAEQVVAAYDKSHPQGPIPAGILPGTYPTGVPFVAPPITGGRPESSLGLTPASGNATPPTGPTTASQAAAAAALTAAQIAAAESAARFTATLAANTARFADVATAARDAATALVQIATDRSRLATDTSAGQVSSISDLAAVQTAQSNAQVQAIQDQSQILADQLAETGLTGTALQAAQAQVALDIQKQTDDARINADQVAIALQKQTDDAKIATATQHEDQVAIKQDALVAKAEARLDAVTIRDQIRVGSAQIAYAVAQASGNTKLEASTLASLDAATKSQTTDQQTYGTALANAQAQQSIANERAASSLAAIQGAASVIEAVLAAQLAGDQGTAAIQEAKLAAIVQQLNAQVAATTAVANSTAATAAATTTAASATIQVTVVTQIDGQTIALTTTPLIRQQLLRTTGRQTQNILGGGAGSLGPSR